MSDATQDEILNGWTTVDRFGRVFRGMPVLPRVLSRLRESDDGCLEFQGHRNRKGYGTVGRSESKSMLAHRAVWIAEHGAIAPGLIVCHRCDNPCCCNIEHLFLGSNADNTRDMLTKGRGFWRVNAGNGKCRLSVQQVEEIRQAREGGESCDSIANRYGVHATHVSRISRGLRRSYA